MTEDTFKLGSISPAAILLDCVDQLENRSPKADSNLQMIKPNLIDAVSSCVAAAGHEFNVHWQEQLLKAASFGKTVLDLFDSDDFVAMTQTVRVLNAVRSHEIGFSLSYDQYLWLGPERLITRLIHRREYALALRLSDFLRLPASSIYVSWAMQKVRFGTEDDETICANIVDKLGGQHNVSFEAIARTAHDEGRHTLATMLLDHEPSAAKQVPLLLQMEEDTLALDKALESGDTDLTLFVLLQLKAKLPMASFFRTINSRPVATALFEETALAQDRDLLKSLYYQDDRRLDSAHLLLRDALSQLDADTKISKLRSSAKPLQESKEFAFQARGVEEYQRLLRLQEVLNNDSELNSAPRPSSGDGNAADGPAPAGRFTGLSLNDTIHTLITLNASKRAQKIATDFRIPERILWHLRLRALIAARRWNELEVLAVNTKKSPIGWEIFYNDTLAAGRPQLAGTFAGKCTEKTPGERSEMYEKCGLWVKAGEEALRARDRARLEDLRERVQGRDAVEIERLVGMVGKR